MNLESTSEFVHCLQRYDPVGYREMRWGNQNFNAALYEKRGYVKKVGQAMFVVALSGE
jgi:hypothetical protein